MNKTTAPKAPSPRPASAVFFTLALDMSWRLAVVVLLPVIVGFKLDERLKTTPWLIVLGFVLAIAGMTLVLKRTVAEANRVTDLAGKSEEKKA